MIIQKKKITAALSKSDSFKILEIDEIVDLESIPIISSFQKTKKFVTINQHSTNSIIHPLIPPDHSDFFFNRIYANSIFTTNSYKERLRFNEVHTTPTTNKQTHSKRNFQKKDCILIIENDFIRRFGVPLDLSVLLNDIKLYFRNLSIENKPKIIWRQRTSDYIGVFNSIKNSFTNFDFFFDSSTSIENLAQLANVSIGFGINSSISYQLAMHGVVNLFGSTEFSEHEYLPNVERFHKLYGPAYAASTSLSILTNSDNIYNELISYQESFISNL